MSLPTTPIDQTDYDLDALFLPTEANLSTDLAPPSSDNGPGRTSEIDIANG
jgi:hypothetical protein